MFLNYILTKLQKFFFPLYKRSLILKGLDFFIFLTILLVIFSSLYAPSDTIGYFAIFSIILTCVKLITKPNTKLTFSTADKFLLIYFIFVIISVAGSTLLYLSFKGFCKTLIYLGFYLSVVEYLKNNKGKIKLLILAVAISATIESLVALYQNFISVSEISGWQDMSHLNPEEVMTRVYGSLKPYNPNLFGGYMLSVIPATLIYIFIPLITKHYKTTTLGFALFILAVIGLVLTGCRGAYIALFAEIILICLLMFKFLKPAFKKFFSMLLGVIACLTCTIIFSVSSLRARIFSIFAMHGDSSNAFRFNVYKSSLQMFTDNWLLGIGVGNQNFREIYGLYMRTGFDALSSYNIYLETAVESGIFALISFLLFLYFNIQKAFRYIIKYKNLNVIYVAIAVISIIGLLVHGFVDTVFFRPQIQFTFWIMVAIIRVLTTRGTAKC